MLDQSETGVTESDKIEAMVKEATPDVQPCHNCRRQRLKCDRTLPRCLKCAGRGQECLGYQRLLRWEKGVASRGKMMGVTLGPTKQVKQYTCVLPPRSLTDPAMWNMTAAERKYLSYFASDVCKDLVLYDTPTDNRFRELIPLTYDYPILLNIIVANSAIRMSNAAQDITSLNVQSSPPPEQIKTHQDALAAKYKALYLLQTVLTNKGSLDADVTLAVVLLFIEFELLYSGRDNWTHHINGARTIIDNLCGAQLFTQASMTPLRSFLISNCLVFDILGSTLANENGLSLHGTLPNRALSLLQDAEGNHCSSFPTTLLHIMQTAARVPRNDIPLSPPGSPPDLQAQRISQLLQKACSFDPSAWATNVQLRSPASDLCLRVHIAFAHRAATCIYLSRTLISVGSYAQPSKSLEHLVSEAINHMAHIRSSDALFTATTWPAFIAGAETNDSSKRTWVVQRFRELWEVEPWGSVRGALEVLRKIWADRDGIRMPSRQVEYNVEADGDDWIGRLRRTGVDWLII